MKPNVRELPSISHKAPSCTVRRVLYPTDLTRPSREALATAIRLARQNNAEILIVHALLPPVPIFETESPDREEAEAALIDLKNSICSHGIKTKRVLIKGTAAVSVSIARCARFFDADLIVMGTGRRTGISRFLAGSIAAKLIRISPCPVLVVKN